MLTYYGTLAGEMTGDDETRPPLVLLHGLGYDLRQWKPVRDQLRGKDPARKVLALDLPGHGASPSLPWYEQDDVAALIWHAVDQAGLQAPILVGHDIGGLLATVYAANFPAYGVVNLDEPLIGGARAEYVRRHEHELRGPSYLRVWQGLLDQMRIDLLPPSPRYFVRAGSCPRQELLLGYWAETLALTATEERERWTKQLEKVRANGASYWHVSGLPVEPTYRSWLTGILPDAVLLPLTGAGHFPHLGRAADVATLLAA